MDVIYQVLIESENNGTLWTFLLCMAQFQVLGKPDKYLMKDNPKAFGMIIITIIVFALQVAYNYFFN